MNTNNKASENQWGIVKCQSDGESREFNKQVRQFLSTGFDPKDFPPIGCLKDHGGGRVFFKGSISFSGGGTLDQGGSPSGAGDLLVAPDSYIEIHIDTKIETMRMAPLKFQASASVPGQVSSSGAAVLNFEDNKGGISLTGEVRGEFFEGRLEYENYTTWQGTSTGYSGVMGLFKIRTCQFFTCS